MIKAFVSHNLPKEFPSKWLQQVKVFQGDVTDVVVLSPCRQIQCATLLFHRKPAQLTSRKRDNVRLNIEKMLLE